MSPCLRVSDPRLWTDQNVAQWLAWTVNEFSLKSVDFEKFCMNGATLCGMGKERFLDLAPDFVGDILWEHLEMLQKGEALLPPPPPPPMHSHDVAASGRVIGDQTIKRKEKKNHTIKSDITASYCWHLPK